MGKTGNSFEKLVEIMAKLRNPAGGCPWDLEQNHKSLRPYVIEEAYEVVDAIDYNQAKLAEELGDLMLQVVFHAQLGKEENTFTIDDVCEGICEKLIRRHPHVFGEVKVENSSEVLKNWEQIKQKELTQDKSILDGVPKSMPAMLRSQRLAEKAARVGFDWHSTRAVSDKVLEEIKEFLEAQEAIEKAHGTDSSELEKKAFEEFGDLLFALAQWARKTGINSEECLSKSCDKFTFRFKMMEQLSKRPLKELSAAELDDLWNQVKACQKTKKD